MGLPIFVVPTEPAEEAKTIEKIAAGSRSSIRRQRNVQAARSRRHRALGPRVGGLERAPPLDDMPTLRRHQSDSLGHLEESTTPTVRTVGRHGLLAMEPHEREGFEREHPSPHFRAPIILPRLESEHTDYRPMSSAIWSELREGNEALRRVDERSGQAARELTQMPQQSISGDILEHYVEGRYFPRAIHRAHEAPSALADADDESNFALARARLGASSSSLSDRVQALNRASSNAEQAHRRLMFRARQARLDGLGDRDRSLSPEGGAAWDTLLTSITPDPQAPSTSSSFTSAAVGASSSPNSDQSSANTSMTSLRRAPDAVPVGVGINECEDSNSDPEENDFVDMLEDRAGRRFWRSYADVVNARADRAARVRPEGELEQLEGMQQIIQHLAERRDIPDEWWAGAGLLRREPTT